MSVEQFASRAHETSRLEYTPRSRVMLRWTRLTVSVTLRRSDPGASKPTTPPVASIPTPISVSLSDITAVIRGGEETASFEFIKAPMTETVLRMRENVMVSLRGQAEAMGIRRVAPRSPAAKVTDCGEDTHEAKTGVEGAPRRETFMDKDRSP